MTRQIFLNRLKRSYEQSLLYGGNQAIKNHITKVEAMDDTQFQAHYTSLEAFRASRSVQSAAARMAREVFR